ncbi:MAG: hypothetical protein MI922_03360, partial [Bacteroidales bacterium]|nr:hypothetical protein [Bacteroidales bacterium]
MNDENTMVNQPLYGTTQIETSNGTTNLYKTTCGMSMLYAPFVLPIHEFLKIAGIEHSGYENIF